MLTTLQSLLYITKGKGTFIFYKEEIPVQEHNLIIVNPNIEHTEKSDTNHPLEYIALGIQGLSFSSIENPSPVTIHNYKQDQKTSSSTFSNWSKKWKTIKKIMI